MGAPTKSMIWGCPAKPGGMVSSLRQARLREQGTLLTRSHRRSAYRTTFLTSATFPPRRTTMQGWLYALIICDAALSVNTACAKTVNSTRDQMPTISLRLLDALLLRGGAPLILAHPVSRFKIECWWCRHHGTIDSASAASICGHSGPANDIAEVFEARG